MKNKGVFMSEYEIVIPEVQAMTVDEYGQFTEEFWFSGVARPTNESIAIMTIGLGGEAGEVQEHIKKLIRDGKLDKEELKKELGDVAYYWARICKQFGFLPSEVLQANKEKLESRKKRGVLRGDGDNR
jgi:NTP pyrophosphatase (non-canonical NTP hydrolase)